MESTILVIMEIVALAAVTILCFYIITVLVKVRSILVVMEHDFKELSAKAIPVFENLEVITDKAKIISENIDEQMDIVKSTILSVKGIADNIADFEQKVQDRIEEPVLETVGTFAAVFKGVRTFIARLRA
jgi:uncharacterized protein YoxC